jgi:hypothetical protein
LFRQVYLKCSNPTLNYFDQKMENKWHYQGMNLHPMWGVGSGD